MPARKFRQHSAPSNDEARYIASRIQDARRKGYSNKVIADSFGINERTIRKIISGETSGKRLYAEHIAPSRVKLPAGASPSIVRLDLVIGKDANGRDVVRTVNAKTMVLRGKTPTPYDVFLKPGLQAIARQEILRMQRQYQGMAVIEADDDELAEAVDNPRIASIRPIIRRDARKRFVTITGDA